jgi:hypothetical protein
MNASRILAIAAFAAAASAGAHAATAVGELGTEQEPSYTMQVRSTADRASVEATARAGDQIVGEGDFGTAVSVQPADTQSRAAVHASAVQAERLGEVARGEG